MKSFLQCGQRLVNGPVRMASRRFLADKIVKTPYMADSITQGTLASWEKKVGEFVKQDETVANIETDKVTIPVNAPAAGLITAHLANQGDTVEVGSDLFKYDPDQINKEEAKEKQPAINSKGKQKETSAEVKSVQEPLRPPSQAEVLEKAEKEEANKISPPTKSLFVTDNEGSLASKGAIVGVRGEHREAISRMRLRIAERMKEAQNTAASLTTFNEVDMSALVALRTKYKEEVSKRHDGIKFGFMSPFIVSCARILQEMPIINARFNASSSETIYHHHVDISVAVATPKGLVTPIIRNCESRDMVEVERILADLSERARTNRIAIEELTGGTFTISNGGVFGSMMGTPILNPPQSAILGMHAIKDRAVVVNGKIEIRPMMYLALTYDHRLIDGREAVTFLVRVKQLLEDPQRLLLDL